MKLANFFEIHLYAWYNYPKCRICGGVCCAVNKHKINVFSVVYMGQFTWDSFEIMFKNKPEREITFKFFTLPSPSPPPYIFKTKCQFVYLQKHLT